MFCESSCQLYSNLKKNYKYVCVSDCDCVCVAQVVFSFSVEYIHTPHLKYEDRMKHYADSQFLPTTFEIHWLSIINSFVLVLLLTAFLTIILMRILKKDFSRYMEVDEVSA